jgi:hypothetical protein
MLPQLLQLYLILTCFIFAGDARKRYTEELVSAYSRIVVLASDASLGVNGTPPTTAQVIAKVLDPNHTSMITSGLYTQTQVDEFVVASNLWFLNNFAINFTAGQTAPNGVIAVPSFGAPLFQLFPYSAQNVVKVTFDSSNLNRGVNDDWIGSQFGVVVACTTHVQFSGGYHAGENCSAGDVLAYFNYNLLKSNSSHSFREDLLVYTPWTSKNILNGQGYFDSLSKLEAVDQQGNIGFFMENIVWNKDVATNIVGTKHRVIITWE